MGNGDTWDKLETLFNEALARPASEREDFVRERCKDDAKTRDELLRLLASHQEMGEFLQAPVLDFTGQMFGMYRTVREIGRGGMSAVYLGERVGGDFQKQVAIKVLLLDTVQALQPRETQILATLEHNHIARLLDSGVTAMGFRYLVMEYVEGVPITAFANGMGEEAKLRLFLQVCEGVHFAHRSLVVHRDLKPDNILVTKDGTVKLLDFGIAKTLVPEAGPQTTGVRAWTADYASPEQILARPVTTASDVYSLGVVLCELIGGRLPRTLAGRTLEEIVVAAQQEEVAQVPLEGDLAVIAGKALRRDPEERYASVNELAADIRRYMEGMPVEARTPSWRYRAGKFIGRHRYMVGAVTLAAAALTVATGVAIWQARLASQRFEQVRALARSVMFEVHDAVSPLRGSLKARKLIIDESLQYLDALAKDRGASNELLQEVAKGYLRLADVLGKDYGGSSLGRSAEALAAAEKAVTTARLVLQRRPQDGKANDVLTDALETAANAHRIRSNYPQAIALVEEGVQRAADKERQATMAKLLGSCLEDSGRAKEAIPHFERALALRKELAAAEPENRRAEQRLAEANQWLANSLFRQRDYERADQHAREAVRIDRIRYARDPRTARMNLSSDIGILANLALHGKRFDEAVQIFEEQLRLRLEVYNDDPNNVVAALRVGAAYDRLGDVHRRANNLPLAILNGKEALRWIRPIQQKDPANSSALHELLYALSDLAFSRAAAKNQAQSCALAREAAKLLADKPAAFKSVHPSVAKRIEATLADCKR